MLALARVVEEIARNTRRLPPRSLCLASRASPWVVPIPGTKRISYLEDNLRAPGLDLSAEDMRPGAARGWSSR